ncbi:MAG: hypothetical protein MK102_05040 [Fuerstiella sp.]|nr:hypothetical protein [Fuerstiella sp.]
MECYRGCRRLFIRGRAGCVLTGETTGFLRTTILLVALHAMVDEWCKVITYQREFVADPAFSEDVERQRSIVRSDSGDGLRSLPLIYSTFVGLHGFRLLRVGDVRERLVRETGCSRQAIDAQVVAGKNVKLAENLNAKIRKNPERFELPLGVFLSFATSPEAKVAVEAMANNRWTRLSFLHTMCRHDQRFINVSPMNELLWRTRNSHLKIPSRRVVRRTAKRKLNLLTCMERNTRNPQCLQIQGDHRAPIVLTNRLTTGFVVSNGM